MDIDPSAFAVHDIGRFPLVTVRNDAIRVGYAAQWAKEMTMLIAHGLPFVVLYINAPEGESHEDFKQRGLWLKQHKQALADVCKALISVEADPVRREAIQARGEGAARAFGIPHDAVSNADEARVTAKRRLDPPGDKPCAVLQRRETD